MLGPEPQDLKAITILNRIIEWKDDGIYYEADPRHVDLILTELNMDHSKGSDVTGAKFSSQDTDRELAPDEAFQYRSLAARFNFLAGDRPDIQFASKEICRSMAQPMLSDWVRVKKLARYLKGHPRHVLKFGWQDCPGEINVYVDTDYAGCPRTRKSTSGGLVMHGDHMIKSWASTQTVIALSSGEAEYYGVVKGACESIGISSIVKDMGMNIQIVLHTDSAAAKGIASRKGIGKVKHLDTRMLWVQSKVDDQTLRIRKIPGSINPADMLTKYLDGARLRALLGKLPVQDQEGRHPLAPRLQGLK